MSYYSSHNYKMEKKKLGAIKDLTKFTSLETGNAEIQMRMLLKCMLLLLYQLWSKTQMIPVEEQEEYKAWILIIQQTL